MQSIYDAVTSVVTAYQQFKADPAKNDPSDFIAGIGTLIGTLQKVSAVAANLKKGDRAALIPQIEGILAIDDSVELAKFFDEVGKAIIEGQRKLDAESAEYNRSLPPSFPQTWYSIPTVKAELKLGFSQVSGKGLNVVVFQNHEQKQKYGESTVTFEVVAAPSPPAMRQAGEPAAESAGRAFGADAPAVEFGSFDGGTAAVDFAVPIAAAESFAADPLTFPLSMSARQPVLNSIAAQLEGPDREMIVSGEAELSALPSHPDAAASQGYLVLCSGSSAEGAGPALRSARAYYAEGSRNEPRLRSKIYHYARPVEQAARVLTVPPQSVRANWAKETPSNLQYLVRNIGDVLNTVVLHARNFHPAFALDAADADEFARRLFKSFPRSRSIRKAFEQDFAIFRDANQSPALYVALHPVTKRTSSEWSEFFIALATDDGKQLGRPEIIRIPDPAELGRIAKAAPRTLVTLSGRLESLLRTLIGIFEHAGPA